MPTSTRYSRRPSGAASVCELRGAVPVQLRVSEFVDAQQVHPPVAGDGLGQHFVVGGLDQFVGQLGREHVAHAVTGHRSLGAQRDGAPT
jgi:hypothetical protein